MNEKELYSKLIIIGKDKELWLESIDFLGSLINNPSYKIRAKVLWILGEIGLKNPNEIKPYVKDIAQNLDSSDGKIRERVITALGRIGRGDYKLICPYFNKIIEMYKDKNANVRMSFILACENIATNNPEGTD